jgi:Domain of unknown function (DUF1942)
LSTNGLAKFAAATAIAASVALGAAGVASTTDSIQAFGEEQTIDDAATGGPLIGYTVTELRPSTDTIPYPVAGRLWEATLKVNAFGNWANPVIPRFLARAENGQGYPSITSVFVPQAIQGNAVPPNGSSSGKLYFDVVGVDPNSVSYNDGVRDILAWVP